MVVGIRRAGRLLVERDIVRLRFFGHGVSAQTSESQKSRCNPVYTYTDARLAAATLRLRKPWIAALFELRYGVIGHGVSLAL